MTKHLADSDVGFAHFTNPKRCAKVLEKDIQREICDWLHEQGYFFWRQNTMPIWDKNHFRALPKYTPRGLPDIMLIHEGTFTGIEVKNVRHGHPSYTDLSPYQKEMRDKIIKNGGAYHVVMSLAEVKAFLPFAPTHSML